MIIMAMVMAIIIMMGFHYLNEDNGTLLSRYDGHLHVFVHPRFYQGSESPTGRPVLMVSGTMSGTVTLGCPGLRCL